MAAYDITIEVTVDGAEFDIEALQMLTQRVLEGEAVREGTGISLLVTTDDEVRQLNHTFLGIDEATDVLSFPEDDGDFVVGGDEAPYIGDIAIALPTAQRQAEEVGHSLDAEIAHLLVHGILHLCGYDHVTSAEDEARMRAREEHYLGGPTKVHAH